MIITPGRSDIPVSIIRFIRYSYVHIVEKKNYNTKINEKVMLFTKTTPYFSVLKKLQFST